MSNQQIFYLLFNVETSLENKARLLQVMDLDSSTVCALFLEDFSID